MEAATYHLHIKDAKTITNTDKYFSYDKGEGTSSVSFSSKGKHKGTYVDSEGTKFDTTDGIKMESPTRILFTNTNTAKVTLVQTISNKSEESLILKMDGTALESFVDNPNGSTTVRVYTLENVAPGQHIVMRNGSETGFMYARVDESENNDPRPSAPISWSPNSIELKIRDTFTAPTFNNAENLTVTFAAAGESATVDSEGNIALVEGKLGTTAVTATYEAVEGGEYKTTVATCTINVLTNVVVDNQPAPYTVGEPIEVAALYKGENKVTAGATLLSDDNIEVIAPFASELGKAAKNYLGQKFTNSIQVRAANAPSDKNPNGTENEGSTTLSVTPKTNLTLVVFGRRQTVEQKDLMTSVDDEVNNVITETHYWGYQPNDGKSLKTVCTEAPDVLLDNEIVLGAFDGKDYAYVAVKLQL
ncbi:MAG: hypothetical protein K2H83_05430, partial [Duncaniella sp.]|nr:hypothetical protein [Duncaniella sp.]